MPSRINHIARQVLLAACTALLMVGAARADVTSISDVPLISATPSAVQPNLMFVLDDSGSMNFDYLPDHVNGTGGSADPKLCRSAGATSTSTGTFNASCCTNSSESAACWVGSVPFTTTGHAPFLAAGFNGLAYNPTTLYKPPVDYQGNSLPSMTRANTSGWTSVRNDYYQIQTTASINLITQFPDLEWCTDTNYGDCLRNGNYVLPSASATVNNKTYQKARVTVASGTGFKAMGAPEAPGVVAQTWGPYYYTIIPNEYCDATNLRNCQVGSSATFRYPALVRWCNSDANAIALNPATNSCQANRTSTYSSARYPTRYPSTATGGSPYVAGVAAIAGASAVTNQLTLATGGTGKCSITSAKLSVSFAGVNNYDLMQGTATTAYTSANVSQLAAGLVSVINSKTGTTTFSATNASGSKVTITGPQSTAVNAATVTLTYAASGGTCTSTTTSLTFNTAGKAPVAAVPPVLAVAGTSAARFERTDILSGNTYVGGANRTDCANNAACTYDEEMTNFANWWTYYHSRMQMMKSDVALAFNGVPTNYRVGYMTINGNQSTAFLNPLTFGAGSTARQTWWTKLTAALPNNSTPLRTALAAMGRFYGGKYNGSTIPKPGSTTNNYGVTVIDPVQYSCQKNYLLLSTDGFWNESNNPKQLDGSTDIGDQDGALPLPQKDGLTASNTLADTAAYYYGTDLRTGTSGDPACLSANTDDSNKYKGNDVCGNSEKDPVQRMSTFTLGLGASGNMQFVADYGKIAGTAPDYDAVASGATASTTVCTWQSSGACTWPAPTSNTLTTIDDLWHAAVNGHGTYFSAADPASLITGLNAALSAIQKDTGAASAVATSTPNITATNNKAFLSTFLSGVWSGELQSRSISTSGSNIGSISATPNWSASPLLDARAWQAGTVGGRNIYMYSTSATNHRRNFDWDALDPTTEQIYFTKSVMVSAGLLQFCSAGNSCLSDADQTAAAGKPVVDYLRGDRTNEGDLTLLKKYFRQRSTVLGDIVDSVAAFVGVPTLHYSDTGYSDFKTQVATRDDMVYVGANDGMLHAFNASTGAEVWAYVPTVLLPKLYKLVDKDYGNKHSFFVDGSPVVRDVYDSVNAKWRTILICGLSAGGRSYFAIDVTNPSDPQPLWEFTNSELGYTYGVAEVSKLTSGPWVVMLPSGYNNVSPGTGVGRLFVLDPITGAQVSSVTSGGIATSAGSTTTPSGLGHIRAWADNADIDNTVQRVYGGDGLGNVWRFDVNDNVGASGIEAQLLVTLVAPDNVTPQPITSRPELGQADNYAMVYVGTGRYMGLSDIGDAEVQSVYGIKDKLDASTYGNPRTTTTDPFVQQVMSDSTCGANLPSCIAGTATRITASPKAVDLSLNGGWFVDLPAKYERDNTDPVLVSGLLVVNSNVIDNSKICSVGGSSWQNYFDYKTGSVLSVFLGNAIATSPNETKNTNLYSTTTLSDGTQDIRQLPPGPNDQMARRTSWRELPTQ